MSPKTSGKHTIDQITIRSWPKVIFLYPVMVASLVCGIAQTFIEIENTQAREIAGLFFFAVFCLNLLVISFEFGRFRTISIIFAIVAVLFLLLYLSHDYEILPRFQKALKSMRISMSTSFYFSLSLYFAGVYVGVYIMTRFNYWVIRSNEILHKEGFLGDVRRYPSPNLRMNKEIRDVFEFLLLGSGRIVLSPATEKQSIVLDHVLRVNRAELGIQSLLSSLSVEIHEDVDDDVAQHGIGG